MADLLTVEADLWSTMTPSSDGPWRLSFTGGDDRQKTITGYFAMREFALRAALAAALMLAPSMANPCLAGSPYDEPSGVGAGRTSDARAVLRRRIGQFTCSYNERRTRLEPKNCGGARY